MSKDTVEIIIPKEANSTEKFAAEELAKYLSKMIDKIRINIVTRQKARKAIYVGVLSDDLDSETSRSDILKELGELDNDGFIIRGIGEILLILGKTSRATLFGVYHYLQILGVRWYFPGEENETQIDDRL
ncbi:MAG: alpha-glucuronidase family glycosyl hydrolase [Thermoproteota archaeon]